MKNKSSVKHAPRQKGILKRTIKSVFHFYPKMLTVSLICIIFNAVVSALPSRIMQTGFSARK